MREDEKVKTSPWRKPIGDSGGISELVKQAWIKNDVDPGMIDVVLHSYREVNNSLECAIEVRYYRDVNGVYEKYPSIIKLFNWICK